MNPCEQEENIAIILKEQESARLLNSQILKNQEVLAKAQEEVALKIDRFFDRLEAVLLTDVERRKDISQLMKDTDYLFSDHRNLCIRVDKLESIRNIQDGMELTSKTGTLWNWYQQERGWRRTIPIALAAISALSALFTFLYKG